MIGKKLATVWLGGCSGCHMSLLDMDERILDVAALADIVKSPVVDGKEMPEVDVAIVEGAITSDEHYEEILHIRKQATILIALGDCAIHNNVTGLRNFFNLQEVLIQVTCTHQATMQKAYHPTTPCCSGSTTRWYRYPKWWMLTFSSTVARPMPIIFST
jgi:coenzyme F420-reducing hydrogenase gamma subunit